MRGGYVHIEFIFFIFTIISEAHCLEEEKDNIERANVIITDNKSLRRIEVRKRYNATAAFPETPTVIQQGNNVYIKPKFIFGSPFTSYKHGYEPNISGNKVPNKETNLDNGKSDSSHSVFVPPVMLPPQVEDYNDINPSILPPQSQVPISLPILCEPLRLPITGDEIFIAMPCPNFVVPVYPDFPLPQKYPIFMERPVSPVVIPKPPELPPIILPQLPITVEIKNPILNSPPNRVPIIVPPLCPPMVECIAPERDMPSFTDIATVLFRKFKSLVTIPNKIDLSKLIAEEKFVLPDRSIAFSTLSAQVIIAERVVPNIVKNDDVKVLINPFIQSQFTSEFKRK